MENVENKLSKMKIDDVVPITHEMDTLKGNTAFLSKASGSCGRDECLKMQGNDGEIDIKLDKWIPVMNEEWQESTKKKRISQAIQIHKLVFEALNTGTTYHECSNLKWMLHFELVKEQLEIQCKPLKPNSAQEYYCTIAMMYLNHYNYSANEIMRSMYQFCRTKQYSFLAEDKKIRENKIKQNQNGELTPKNEHGFKILMNKNALKQLYDKADLQHKILHLLLMMTKLVCRNELRFLYLYYTEQLTTAPEIIEPNRIVIYTENGNLHGHIYLECFKTSKTEPERYIQFTTNDAELMRLLKDHYLSHDTAGPVVLFTDTNGKHMMGKNRSDMFTKFVNTYFWPICEQEKNFKIGTTLVRFYHASKHTKEVYKLKQRLNELVTPFAHGAIKLGTHSEYLFVLPNQDIDSHPESLVEMQNNMPNKEGGDS